MFLIILYRILYSESETYDDLNNLTIDELLEMIHESNLLLMAITIRACDNKLSTFDWDLFNSRYLNKITLYDLPKTKEKRKFLSCDNDSLDSKRKNVNSLTVDSLCLMYSMCWISYLTISDIILKNNNDLSFEKVIHIDNIVECPKTHIQCLIQLIIYHCKDDLQAR